VAKYFRINPSRANTIIDEVVAAVCGWREAAKAIGISRREQDDMQSAFSVAEGSTAKRPRGGRVE
jgi:serine/threonine-protein kinase HipA